MSGAKASVSSRKALVVGDTYGALTIDGKTSLVPPPQVINSGSYVAQGRTVLLGPTTATVAIDRVGLMNTSANWSTSAAFYMYLQTVQGETTTDCYNNSAGSIRAVAQADPGSNLSLELPTPLVFKPTSNTAKYCIVVTLAYVNAAPSSYYLPWAQLTGYTVAGTYAGPGAATSGVAANSSQPTGAPPSSGGGANLENAPPVSATGAPLPSEGPPPLVTNGE